MASLGGTTRGEVKVSRASIAQARTTSLTDDSKSVIMDEQRNHDNHNDSDELSSSAMSENQVNQNDNKSEIASISTPVDNPCSIIVDQLAERLSNLPQKYLDRYMKLQDNSCFWKNLFNQPSNTDATGCPPLKSREWASFVVEASRIFFEARLPVREIVSIINHTLRSVTICLLNCGKQTIYFEDGRNVFYEPQSGGMTELQKTKYEEFLRKMRATLLEGKEEAQPDSEMEVISDSGDESEAVGEVSLQEDAVALAKGHVMITSQEGTVNTLPGELSTIPAEVEPSTLEVEERNDSQVQDAIKPPQTKKGRNNRARLTLKRKERRKRARACKEKVLSSSEDITNSKDKKGVWWRQNRKKKEKMKKANAAARQVAGM